jgi:CDP-4-dehydro-6-deoxyglucose reductase, E1
MRIPLASSGLRDSDIDLVMGVLKSGNLTMGKEVKRFEKLMSDYLQAEHFIMVNSGSSANLAMIEALIRPTKSKPMLNHGDCVLVPAIAWPTTIWPLIQLGLNPIFIDISPKTLALDLDAAQKFIDESGIHIRGIFPIHPLGYAIPNRALEEFVGRNDLILINDVCESLGSWDSENRHAGSAGIASSYSFYFSHHITTMEGGGVATNNSELADDIRSIRSHGWSRDRSDSASWTKNKTSNDSKFLFVSTGYNIRPMEIQAVIGSSQITMIDDFVNRRRHIAKLVIESLKGTSMQVLGDQTVNSRENSWMLIPIQVNNGRKNQVLEVLEKFEIETRPVLTGNFLAQPAIQRITKHAVDPGNFAGANYISENCFLVGAHHDLTDKQIEYLCSALKKAAQVISE